MVGDLFRLISSNLLPGLWDTALITKSVREIRNYTHPLPSRQVESVLTGNIYDPYVRLIVWEGIRKWWINDLQEWLACPDAEDRSDPPAAGQQIFSSPMASMLSDKLQRGIQQTVCPMHWALPTHELCCSHVFPPTGSYNYSDPTELNIPSYYGKIAGDKVIEKQLAKAGIRLASVLNTILADEGELAAFGSVSLAKSGLNL